jgi:hypothetical protein
MTLRYTTVGGLWRSIKILKSTQDYEPGSQPIRDTIASNPVTAGTYYLAHAGVDEDSLALYRSDGSALTVTTHYTFDSDRSKVTITATGATYLTGYNLDADYDYNIMGRDMTYNDSKTLLDGIERGIEDDCDLVFADQSSADPRYEFHKDEKLTGRGYADDVYDLKYYPCVKLSTTTNGAYTAGASTITLTDGSGFPQFGNINIGGNEVTITARTGNTLSITPLTVNVASGAVVRGEIVKVSLDPRGLQPVFQILTPDIHYSFDADTGRIMLYDDYFIRDTYGLIRPIEGADDRMRVSYYVGWHCPTVDCYIPGDIAQLVYTRAARRLMQSTLYKSVISNKTGIEFMSFTPNEREDEKIISQYRALKIDRC